MNTQLPTPLQVLLIGDNCIDTYQYGTVDRISPEAPVPVFCQTRSDERPGMAGNVRANLEALGCDVTFITGKSSQKTRIIDERSGQHIVRIDNDVRSAPLILPSIDLSVFDVIVVSDYNKGTVSYEFIQEVRSKFDGPVFVDTKKTDLNKLEGCFIKINEHEYNRATSLPSSKYQGTLIVTKGEQGVYYDGRIFPTGKVSVSDVTGAGDTFLAALAYAYIRRPNMFWAISFAQCAASLTVQHNGVYAPTYSEIIEHAGITYWP